MTANDDEWVFDASDDIDSSLVEIVAVPLSRDQIISAVGAPLSPHTTVEVDHPHLTPRPVVRVIVTLTDDQLRRAAGAPAGSLVQVQPISPVSTTGSNLVRVRWRRWRGGE